MNIIIKFFLITVFSHILTCGPNKKYNSSSYLDTTSKKATEDKSPNHNRSQALIDRQKSAIVSLLAQQAETQRKRAQKEIITLEKKQATATARALERERNAMILHDNESKQWRDDYNLGQKLKQDHENELRKLAELKIKKSQDYQNRIRLKQSQLKNAVIAKYLSHPYISSIQKDKELAELTLEKIAQIIEAENAAKKQAQLIAKYKKKQHETQVVENAKRTAESEEKLRQQIIQNQKYRELQQKLAAEQERIQSKIDDWRWEHDCADFHNY